jgi:hypothetical protein
MSHNVQALRIVVASPADTQPEREAVDSVVTELNRGAAPELGVLLTVTRWETSSYPGFHPSGPQGLIDEILAIPECDVFVGIFWKRLGTPVHDSPSGTLHEFGAAYEAWKATRKPAIMFYFNEEPYSPRHAEELQQWARVLDFKEKFPKEGLWWAYKGCASFEALLRQHLTRLLLRISKATGARTDDKNKFGQLADSIATQLPKSKGFRGRISELHRLKSKLNSDDITIVVIEGISGIGKSALAKHFAATALSETSSPFWYDCHRETTLDGLTWELAKFARKQNREGAAMAFEEPSGTVLERMTRIASALSEQPFTIFLDDYHLVLDSN